VNNGDDAHGQIARSEERQRGVGQNDAGKDGVLTMSFIGPKEERSVRPAAGGECSFKAMIFKAETREGELGRRRFGGGIEDGGSTRRFLFSSFDGEQRTMVCATVVKPNRRQRDLGA
jgi:hypothetical protein